MTNMLPLMPNQVFIEDGNEAFEVDVHKNKNQCISRLLKGREIHLHVIVCLKE